MRIGIFIGDIYQTYSSIIIKEMEAYARDNNITLHIFGSFATPGKNILHAEGEKSILYLPELEELEGIIIAGDTMGHFGMEQELRERLDREAKCPIVSIRSREEGYYNVLIDNVTAMYDMTNHFIKDHGFRDICFVTGRMTMEDAGKRLEGYRKAMAEAEIPVTEKMIFYGNYWKDQGAEIVDYFIKGRKKLPSAIICSNDYMALAVCEELQCRGIRVPEDICISGFDDLEEGQMFQPALSSVHIPFEKMARQALETVVALAGGKDVDKCQLIHGENCCRHSCGCGRDSVSFSNNRCRSRNKKFRYMAKECIYLSADFESALNEKECLEWVGHYIRGFDVENCFICLKQRNRNDQGDSVKTVWGEHISLRHYLDEKGKSVFADIPFREKQLLPTQYLPLLENKVNIFIPLHCKNEVYGYFIFQMKSGRDSIMDEKYEFFCMNVGNTLKRIYMYDELFSVHDIMQLCIKDPLTNIYNRRGFERKLLEVCDVVKRNGKRIAVVSIDMDGLKYINDHFGHLKGDESLIAFSRCLCAVLEKGEFCARMGGDEFAVVLLLDEPRRTERFQNQLQDKMTLENKRIKEPYMLDASIGICEVENNDSVMEYIQLADKKMYENKRRKALDKRRIEDAGKIIL